MRRTIVFRCIDGAVLLGTAGASLNCGKADTNRTLTAARRYCRENPDASSIPAYVTGHDTVYAWRCRRAQASAARPSCARAHRG